MSSALKCWTISSAFKIFSLNYRVLYEQNILDVIINQWNAFWVDDKFPYQVPMCKGIPSIKMLSVEGIVWYSWILIFCELAIRFPGDWVTASSDIHNLLNIYVGLHTTRNISFLEEFKDGCYAHIWCNTFYILHRIVVWHMMPERTMLFFLICYLLRLWNA